MRKDPKKIVAAAMGVIEYLRAEAERGREEQRAGMRTAPPIAGPPVQPAVSPWAASGRMELMRFRNLMELRIFRRGGK